MLLLDFGAALNRGVEGCEGQLEALSMGCLGADKASLRWCTADVVDRICQHDTQTMSVAEGQEFGQRVWGPAMKLRASGGDELVVQLAAATGAGGGERFWVPRRTPPLLMRLAACARPPPRTDIRFRTHGKRCMLGIVVVVVFILLLIWVVRCRGRACA